MYLPSGFRQDDPVQLHALMRETRLTTLVSQGDHGLLASHLPLLLAEDEGEHGVLYGHFARANPHWKDLAAGAEALALFNGPDAYISPAWYAAKAEHGRVVPTWNYIAVHAYGKAEIFDDRDRLLDIVSRLSDRHERIRPRPWAVSDAPVDYIDGMLRAIVGFVLPIRRLEGKWKLGQNRSPSDQQGVHDGLTTSTDPRDQALAERMTAPIDPQDKDAS